MNDKISYVCVWCDTANAIKCTKSVIRPPMSAKADANKYPFMVFLRPIKKHLTSWGEYKFSFVTGMTPNALITKAARKNTAAKMFK